MGRVSEEKRRRKKIKKRDSLRRIKIQVREKVGKSRNTLYFQWFVVSLTFWLGNVLRTTTASTFFDMSTSKSGPIMVRFVHFDLDTSFAPQRRALFRHLNFQKWSETGVLCTFWLGNVLRATTACNFPSLIWPAGSARALLDVQMSFRVAGARDCEPCQKSTKREGFVAQAWDFWRRSASISRGRRSTRDISIRHVSKGADFLRGAAFWSIRSSGLLRWFCMTGAALRMTWHHFFVAGAALYTDGVEKSQNAFGTRPSALHSTFHRWRKSRRTASFLMLSTCKIEDVSQNCFVFDGLAELLRFWCCQVQKLRRSRRIASFLMLSSSKNEEVSQNCCVFDVVNFNNWGSLAE